MLISYNYFLLETDLPEPTPANIITGCISIPSACFLITPPSFVVTDFIIIYFNIERKGRLYSCNDIRHQHPYYNVGRNYVPFKVIY